MQDEEGMVRKKGDETGERTERGLKRKGVYSTVRTVLMACGYTEWRGRGKKSESGRK